MFADKLKQIAPLRRTIKKIRVFRDYFIDASFFSRFYMESEMKRGNYNYKLLLLIHSIEKGLCIKGDRPFGQMKVNTMLDIIEKYKNVGCFEYRLSIGTFINWTLYYEEKNWVTDKTYLRVKEFLKKQKFDSHEEIDSFINVQKPHISPLSSYDEVVSSRHSVREFENTVLDYSDIEYALRKFADSPTACNRQMCKVYFVRNTEGRNLLLKSIMGISGFDKQTVNLFVITYDTSAFDFSGERNQGMFNSGLSVMNFVNALHSIGVGTCIMQWANTHRENKTIKRALGIPQNEVIATIVGAGQYKDVTTVPKSNRRDTKDIFCIID